ncbi:Axial budding pattern protein 2 [Elsinoe australis]|uniref:Axial budding pattern protein 2 n=1 Tax=Elsinoe australis TaxID=40998 RepID=A0A2P7ZY27_9PEZI|nr:Axial budding pattern protein 2 [Elsinoe australis]
MRLVILGYIAFAAAVPQIAFPFNAQVPPAARITEPYRFQFAAATFGGSSSIGYDLVNPPAWLRLDDQRTLTGTPSTGDQGTQTFGIRASDATGSTTLDCTLVVTEGEGPRVSEDASGQLSKFGRLSSPGTLAIYPSDAFTLQFDQQTFQQGRASIRAYYAVLADRTPLPAWIGFNPTALSFFGVAPAIGDESQTYIITIIASDIAGFSGAETTFTLRISRRQLVFSPQRQEYTIDGDVNVDLSGQLYLDTAVIPHSQIIVSTLSAPGWLKLNSQTLIVSGQTPNDFTYQEASVNVQDAFGNMAQKTLVLKRQGMNTTNIPRDGPDFPDIQISNVTVRAGQNIDFALPEELVRSSDFRATVAFNPPQEWLSYDEDKGKLRGTVQDQVSPTDVQVVITLTTSSQKSAVRTFYVNIEEAEEGPSPTPISTGPGMIGEDPSSRNGPGPYRLSGKKVAGIVVGLLAAVVLLAILITIWCQRRRKRRRSIDKSNISRPMIERRDTFQLSSHTEIAIDPVPPITPRLEDQPPRIHLDVPDSPMRTSPFKKSRMSTASSLGEGEHAILSDNNIPVLGQSRRHGQHDSYTAAKQLSFPRPPSRSDTKRTTLQVLPNRHSRPLTATGPDLKSQNGSFLPSQSALDPRLASPPPSSTDIPSLPSPSTSRPNSVLHRPLSQLASFNRRSVRLVAPSSSRLSGFSRASTITNREVDRRPIGDKRASFIKNRKSSGVPSPYFTSANRDQRVLQHEHQRQGSSFGGSGMSPYGHGVGKRKTYSESSSLEPPARNPARLNRAPRVLSVERPRIPGATTPSDDGSNWSTLSGSDEDEGNGEEKRFMEEAALPRQQRAWVLPGEASPTPPPSVVVRDRSREELRRKWQQKLGRKSTGEVASSSPLARGGQGYEVIEPSIREPLRLISNDSFSGDMGGTGKGKEAEGESLVLKRVRERERGSSPAFI